MNPERFDLLPPISDWLSTAMAALGLDQPAEVRAAHVRPWASVYRVCTTSRVLWLKCNRVGGRHEAELLRLIFRRLGGEVPEVVWFDDQTGWFLMRDAGQASVPLADPAAEARRWEAALEQYGNLQRALVPDVDRMMACGVPDYRPARLTRLFGELVTADPSIDAPLRALLTAVAPQVARWSEWLNDSGFDASIQHDDLHLGNLLVPPSGAGFTIIDWADASVSHPLCSLLYPLHAAIQRGDSTAQRQRLLDAYLAGWGDRPAMRIGLVEAALRMASIPRALMWQRVRLEIGIEELSEYYSSGVPRWLTRLTDGSWAGVRLDQPAAATGLEAQ